MALVINYSLFSELQSATSTYTLHRRGMKEIDSALIEQLNTNLLIIIIIQPLISIYRKKLVVLCYNLLIFT